MDPISFEKLVTKFRTKQAITQEDLKNNIPLWQAYGFNTHEECVKHIRKSYGQKN